MTTFPLPGARVTAGFGPYPSIPGEHYGIDLAKTGGGTILANRTGRVTTAGWDYNTPSFGWHVRIQTGDLLLIYGHMRERPLVTVGQWVTEGQHLGEQGATGNATGDHLHFEVRKGGTSRAYAVDPVPYLGIDPTKAPPITDTEGDDDMPTTEEIAKAAGRGVHEQALGRLMATPTQPMTFSIAASRTVQNVEKILAQVSALTAIVQALVDRDPDLDGEQLTTAVLERVDAALANVRLVLETADEGAGQ